MGFRSLSDQAGDAANTFKLPAYGVLDAGLYYDRGRFHAQLNVNNVTDERYASGSFNDLYVQVGDPIDPYTAAMRAAPTDTNGTFTGWMLNLHYKFFAGTIGVAITGVLAILLCLLGLTGFWIYRGFWKHFLRLRWRKKRPHFLF